MNTTDTRNAELDALNLADWATAPEVFTAYYTLASEENQTPRPYGGTFRTHGRLHSWLGADMGVITEARVYRHNFGGRMVNIRVRATNGAEYYGRASYDWGSVVTVRKVKVRS